MAGIISFAGQSTQTIRSIADQKMPTCFAVVRNGNVTMVTYSTDCIAALSAAHFMLINSDSGVPVFDNITVRPNFILP